MVEIRRFACGCVDTHDYSLWASTCVTPCKEHDSEDFDPECCRAFLEGIPYTVEGA